MKTLVCILTFLTASLAFGQLPPGVTPQPAPNNANDLSGGPFLFEVTGNISFPNQIWGTNRYWVNSSIAMAAVHAGILNVGEAGVIKLTLTGNQTYVGSTQNGVTSFAFGAALAGFEMERVILPDFTITSQPQGGVADAGAPVTINVGVSGSGQTFQWYIGMPGDLTQPVPSGTTASLTVAATDPPLTYWVSVSNASGSLGSLGATVAARVTGTVEGWQDFTVNLPGAPSAGDQASLMYADGELYVLGQTGVYRSTDGGNTFSTINTVSGTGSYNLGVSQLRFVKKANSFIYVGDARNPASNTNNYTPLHRLTAGQTSWTQASQVSLPDTVFTDSVEDVAYDPATGAYYAASNFAGCYYSADGLTWEERRTGLPTQGTSASGPFANATSVLVRNGKVFLTVQHPTLGGVYTSVDQAQTWSRTSVPSGGLPRLFAQGGRVFAVTSGVNTISDGTYVSDDNGVTWERRPFLNLLSQIRGNGSLLVATPGIFGAQDLRFSTTRGDTWDEINRTGLPNNYIWRAIEPSGTDLYLIGYELGAGNVPQNMKVFRRPISQLNLTPRPQFLLPTSVVSAGFQRNSGTAFSLSIGAAPAGTVTYVWRKNGDVLANQTSATLSLPSVSDTDAGSYTVEIIGANGSSGVSNAAQLTIVPSTPGNGDTSFPQADSTRSGGLVVYDDFRLLHTDGNYMALYGADGKFVTSRINAADGRLRRGFMDSRGNLMLFGEFTLTRINRDTLANDTSFAPVVFTGTTNTIRLHDVIELPGRGYLLAVEPGLVINGITIPPTALFDYSGNYVPSATFASAGRRLALAPDGKIYVGLRGIQRMLSNGALDTSFTGPNVQGGENFVVHPDGSVLYANSAVMFKLNDNGSPNSDFASRRPQFNNGSITGIVCEPSGKILVYGTFQRFDGRSAAGHARLNADGSPDNSYSISPGYYFFGTPSGIGHVTYDPRGSFFFFPTSAGLTFNQTGRIGLAKVFADRPGISLYGQPVRQSVANGGSVTLRAGVTGTSTVSYQWFKDGVAINGATSPTLSLSGFGNPQAGRYSFTATNASGTVTSREARIDLVGAPDIVDISKPVAANEGTPLTLSVTASGNATLTYQWTKNGTPIPTATAASYQFPTTDVSDSGSYRVIITNGVASITSDPISVVFQAISGRIFPGTEPSAPAPGLNAVAILPDGSYLVGGGQNGGLIAFYHISAAGQIINDSWTALGQAGLVSAVSKIELNRARDRVYVYATNSFTNASFFNRYFLDGTRDTTFVPQASGPVMAERTDGSLWVASGIGASNRIDLISQTGALLSTVLPPNNVSSAVRAIFPLKDGSALVGGNFRELDPNTSATIKGLIRVLPDGTVDDTFPLILSGITVMDIAIQSSGMLVLATSSNTLARISTDGIVDSTFTGTGLPSGSVQALEVEFDDRLIVFGATSTYRRMANGAPDPSFLPLTDFSTANFKAVQSDPSGRLYAVGAFTRRSTGASVTTAILTTTAQPSGAAAITAFYTAAGIPAAEQADDADFDNDGVPNLLEYLYGTSPGAASAAPSFSRSASNLTGASINAILPAGLDPTQTYYVVEIRLPKDLKGLNVTIPTTTSFPFSPGGGSLNPYGPITDDGDFTIQSYYSLPSIQVAPRAFWRVEATR